MNRILLCLLVAAVSLTAHAQGSAPIRTLTITESGEGFNDISATLSTPGEADVSVPLTLTGAADAWTIELPAAYALSSLGSVLVGEPEDPDLINEVLVGTQPTFLTWTSDIPRPAGVGPVANIIEIPLAGTFGNLPLNLVLRDIPAPTTVPDSGTTTLLLLSGLAPLLMLARLSRSRRLARA